MACPAGEPPRRPLFCAECNRPIEAAKAWWVMRRGLCRPCYRDPEIRGRYPCGGTLSVAGTGNSHERDRTGGVRLDPSPTDAEPGSPRKQEVMKARESRGYSLFHPDDARLPPGARSAVYDRTLARLRHLFRLLRRAQPCGPAERV